MKVVKPKKALTLAVLPLVVITTTIIAWFFSNGAVQSLKVFWLPLVIAALFVASPLGGRKLCQQDETPQYKLFPWLFRIVGLEFLLLASFAGITYISTSAFAIHVPQGNHFFAKTLSYFSLHLGLFPWSVYALIAVAIGLTAFAANKNAMLSNLLYPLFKSREQQSLGAVFNVFAKIGTGFAFACTLIFFILLIASLVSPHHIPMAFGFSTATTLLVMVLLIFSFTNSFHKYIQRLLSHKIPYGVSLTLLCVLFAAIILLLSVIFIAFSGGHTGKVPGIVQALLKKNWHDFWLIFSSTWWLAWTLVIGSHIARISRGRSARAVILAVLALPILFGIYFYLVHVGTLHLFSIHPLLIYLISMAGMIGLLSVVSTRKHLTPLMLSFLPRQTKEKPHQHAALSQKFFFKRSWQLAMGLLYLYLPAGIAAVSFLFFMAIAPLAILLLLVCVALFFY